MEKIILPIEDKLFSKHKVKLFMLCLYKLNFEPNGNKYFKLKYNIQEAIDKKCTGILTFGGAYSNHILASAKAANKNNLKCIGIIRGEKPENLSPTLKDVVNLGMNLQFVSRSEYKKRNEVNYLTELQQKFPSYYIIPEGGTNKLAIKGTSEIVNLLEDIDFDYLCASIGTGGTIAGLCNSKQLKSNQKILGFSALKGSFIEQEIRNLLENDDAKIKNLNTFTEYHCGGYAKVPQKLLNFIINFYAEYKIPLDPIYNSKMLLGIYDLVEKEYFKQNSTIVMIHSGGLQGLRGKPALSYIYDEHL